MIIKMGGSQGTGAKYFGDGSDGDLTVVADQILELEVAQDEGQIIKQYKNLTVEAGAVLKAANRCNGMILLVTGNLVVNGTINMDGLAPFANDSEDTAQQEIHVNICGLIGGNGGNGGNGSNGPGGGAGSSGNWCGGGWPGGGGGGYNRYDWGSLNWTLQAFAGGDGTRPVHGMNWPVAGGKAAAGSYGSGGSATYSGGGTGGASPGGGGGGCVVVSKGSSGNPVNGTAGNGYPGGGLWIFVKGNVTIGASGIISADGKDGGAGGTYTNGSVIGGGGGGAGGGIVALIYGGSIVNSGSVRAYGGKGAAGSTAGQDGAVGAVLVQQINDFLAAMKGGIL